MEAVYVDLVVWLAASAVRLALSPSAELAVTVGVGLLAAGLLVGAFLLGRAVGRRRSVNVGAEDVLTALERTVRGDMGGALSVLQGASRSPDAPAELYLAMASLLRAMGHTERSAQVHLAVSQRPDLDAVLATRATLGLAADYLTLGKARAAEELIKRLPRKIRRQEALLALRRNAALKAGDWKEALAAGNLLARRASNGGGAVSEIYSHMATAALARGEPDEAAGNFRRALRKDADNLHAREGLARIYLAQDKRFRARRLLAQGLAQCPDAAPRLLPLMRLALVQRDRYRKWLEEMADKGEGSPWVDLELAEIAYSEDDIEEATVILEDLVRLYPDSIDVCEAHLNLLIAVADERTIFAEVDRFMDLAGQTVHRFRCGSCDFSSAATFVKCPRCGECGTVRYAPPRRNGAVVSR